MVQRQVEPQIVEYLHRKAAIQKTPLSGSFELTPLCNMSCKMCYVKLTKEEMNDRGQLLSKKQWLEIAKEAKEKGTLFLLLTGGEPFSRKDFREIYEELHKMGFSISINSNGTLIDEEQIAWLKKCPPARINISLYGASDETYARLCNNPTGFTKVVKAIKGLKEAGILVKLNCSITPYNCHDLEEVIAFSEREGLILQATPYMFPPIRVDEESVGQNQRFSAEDTARQLLNTFRLQYGEENFRRYIENYGTDIEQFCSDSECFEGDQIHCRAGSCSYWITWDGKMLPCGMMTKPFVSVTELGFDNAWRQIVNLTEQIRLPKECAACSIKDKCKTCAAMVLAETGDFNEVPTFRCEMMKAHKYLCEQIKKVNEFE